MFNKRIKSIKPQFLLLLFIIMLVIYGLGSSFLYRTFGLTGYIIGRLFFALACYFWFIHFHKGNRLLTEAHPFFQAPAFSLIFLLIFVVLYMVHLFDVPGNITALLKQDISSILCNTFIALTAGIFEETIFRGIGADTFCAWYKETNHPLCHSAIWTSLIFGLSHLSNMNGTDSSQVWIQVFYACMLGMALYAWRILTNGMILPIMLHFLIDLQPNLLTEDVAAGSFCIYVVIFLPLGLLSFALIYQLEKNLK